MNKEAHLLLIPRGDRQRWSGRAPCPEPAIVFESQRASEISGTVRANIFPSGHSPFPKKEKHSF